MADNTARARKQLEGARSSVAEHVEKWRRYSDPNDKSFALKTVERVQKEISKIKSNHPSLNHSSWEDSWRPS